MIQLRRFIIQQCLPGKGEEEDYSRRIEEWLTCYYSARTRVYIHNSVNRFACYSGYSLMFFLKVHLLWKVENNSALNTSTLLHSNHYLTFPSQDIFSLSTFRLFRIFRSNMSCESISLTSRDIFKIFKFNFFYG